MAKKAGAAQLQVDITTDEDLDRFLDNQGLSLLDVYAGWCGPCVGMVTSLRKAKLEMGGEMLHLATCRSDNIEALVRFRNKSEPTWLFVTKGKLINITFGAEIPKLMRIIANEIHKVSTKTAPEGVSLRELLPVEKERVAKIEAAAEKIRLAKEREIKKKRLDYLNYCTGEILGYTPGFGVTLFGPHINRDHIKKVVEVAEVEKLACKDRKALILLPEHIEVLNYACNNPINEDALEQMYDKEILILYWKMPDGDKRSTEEIMANFVNRITKPQPTEDGEGMIPPILASIDVKVKAPKEPEIEEPEIEETGIADFGMPTEEQEEVIEEDEVVDEHEEMEVSSHESVVAKKSSSFLYMVTVPAMWSPGNRKTTAAAIYVFFRNQTTSFLPPDPVPEPPHLIVVFDAWKRKDVTDVMNKFTDEILTYGYFTTEEPETAKLIANSTSAYGKQAANRFDKLVVKVAKRTSHAVLALASHGPSYVSPNTDIGKLEALRFFPEGYNNEEIVEQRESKAKNEATIKTEAVAEKPAETADKHATGEAEAHAPEGEVPAAGDAPHAEGDAPPAEADAPPPAEEPPAE